MQFASAIVETVPAFNIRVSSWQVLIENHLHRVIPRRIMNIKAAYKPLYPCAEGKTFSKGEQQ